MSFASSLFLAASLLAHDGVGDDAQTWSGLQWTRFTTSDGMPQNAGTSLVQDSDGFLLIGTHGGMTWFDGVEFRAHDQANHPALLSNRVVALLAASDGDVWAGTRGQGAFVWDGETFHLPDAEGAPTGSVFSIGEGSDGAIWMGGDQLHRFDGRSFERVEFEDGTPPNVHRLRVDRRGGVWVCALEGVGRVIELEGGHHLRRVPLDVGEVVPFLAESPRGTVWASRGSWAGRFDGERFRSIEFSGDVPEMLAVDLVTRDGEYWVAGRDGLFRCEERVDASGVTTGFHLERAAPRELTGDEGVRSLLEDREGNLWVGTHADGILRGSRAAFELIHLPSRGESRWPAYLPLEDGTDSWLVQAYGARRWIEGRWVEVPELDLAPDVEVVASGNEGGVWLASLEGEIVHTQRGNTTSVKHDLGRILRMLEGRDGRLWIASERGLFTLDDGHIEPVTALGAPVRSTALIQVLHETARGDVWFGAQGLLVRCTGRRLRIDTDDGLPNAEIRSIYEARDGRLWVATYGAGLLSYHAGKISQITTTQGLPDNSLGKIVEDDLGNLWINSNRGAIHVELEALYDLIAGRAEDLVAHLALTGEGNGESGGRLPDGRIWLPTVGSLAIIDPDAVERNDAVPLVHVLSVQVDGVETPLGETIELAPGIRDIEIAYTAPNLTDPDRTRFRTMLSGYDDEWVDAGSKRSVRYSQLPPGNYAFRVEARNEDGVWSEADQSVVIRQAPYFFETRWFFWGSVAGLLGLVMVASRIRVRRLHRRNLALRSEIAIRRKMESAMREGEARLRVALSAAAMGTWHYDAVGQRSMRDANLSRLLGLQPGWVRGEDLYGTIHADDRDRVFAEYRRAIRDRDVLRREFRVVRPDGGVRWLSDQGRPYFDEMGRLAYVTGAVVDITDAKREEGERIDLEKQLRHKQKMEAIGQLAAGVAHEFNNLLVGINGNASLILEDNEDLAANLRVKLEGIQRSGDRAAALTRQLLTFARKDRSRPATFDLNEVVSSSKDMLVRLLGERVELRVLFDANERWVKADRGEIEQALINLVLNARDATTGFGSVEVRTSSVFLDDTYVSKRPSARPGPHVELTVADTGCGMSSETLEHIFEPFFTTKPPGEGTGLGLSTTFADVSKAGGHMTVESQPGEGTVFHIYLPRAEAEILVPRSPAHAQVKGGGETILLVDDEEMVLDVLASFLKSGGYRVMRAAGESDALAFAEHGDRIDLLLTDVDMPHMSGPEVARAVRRLHPTTRVLYISGYGAEVALPGGVETAKDFIQKPISREALLRAVREMLDRGAPTTAPE